MPSLPSFDLQGRVALVTGGGRGIGRAIATALAHSGAFVAVTGRTLTALDATLTELRALGAEWAPLDILVNNAGVEEVRPSLDVDEALWDRILDTNLKGAFFSAQAAAARMKADGRGGAIINLCSLTSAVGVPTAVPYGSSKSGLLGMTRALAAEWAPLDIRVNAIASGYFHTDMTDVFYKDEAWRSRMLARIPQARFGELDDLQGVAVFLASDASRYMTGQCLTVDGGFLASI